jgi:hypothetical protein
MKRSTERLLTTHVGRLARPADLLEIAGTDCGFGTSADRTRVFPSISSWAKLQPLAEGARLASAQLWG